MYVNVIANSIMLHLWQDFYNTILKIKYKLHIASGLAPDPLPSDQFWVRPCSKYFSQFPRTELKWSYKYRFSCLKYSKDGREAAVSFTLLQHILDVNLARRLSLHQKNGCLYMNILITESADCALKCVAVTISHCHPTCINLIQETKP